MILITGSHGLIGRAIATRLGDDGHDIRTFDIRTDPRQDIRNPEAVESALDGVEGVIHLAAVSRVVWAQADPDLAWAVNVDALSSLIAARRRGARPPWLVFASSREVYGEPLSLPVAETAQIAPLNIYARSKVAGEQLLRDASADGAANVVRLSNVYGCVEDHADRVVPAFARAAATGGSVRIEGPDHMFDFTHVSDVARGLHRLVDATRGGAQLDPIHLVTGQGTTLGQLAEIAATTSHDPITKERRPPRNYDVARFTGCPERAAEVLGWRASVDIQTGFGRLVEGFRHQFAMAPRVPRETKPRFAAIG